MIFVTIINAYGLRLISRMGTMAQRRLNMFQNKTVCKHTFYFKNKNITKVYYTYYYNCNENNSFTD